MYTDYVEKAIKEIASFLQNECDDIKFAVKFNGEFFIADANKMVPDLGINANIECCNIIKIEKNRLYFVPSDSWIKHSIEKVQKAAAGNAGLIISSQIKRLNKQIEFGLTGGPWCGEAYKLALGVLYMLHTKSDNIRRKVVKRCAGEYNKLQRMGAVPTELVNGYINALCQISNR